MGNPLGPFSNTSDWPEWPKSSFMAIYGHLKYGEMGEDGQTYNFSSDHARADMQKTSSTSSTACVIFVEAVSIFW